MVLGGAVGGHGDGVPNRYLIANDLDAFDEVADQGLALRDGAGLEEIAELRNVPLDFRSRWQIGAPLLQLVDCVISRRGELILLLSQLENGGESAS